jgi:branched-chain amino acid transport system ATP-binding protein
VKDHILELEKIRKEFGGVVAVNDIDLHVNKGSITSVIGPNGAGKTTIFNLITGFLPPTGGKINFKGDDIGGKKSFEIAALGIARTFQQVQIFPDMTVLENIMVGRHLRSTSGFLSSAFLPPFLRKEEFKIKRDAEKWLEFINLQEFSKMPAGSLPLGSQRMLEIARALAMEPEFLLLDEPASGLNARETVSLGGLINKIRQTHITVMLVEHDMELVMDISDMVTVINFGSLIAHGTPVEIQENQQVISAYLGE